jgi:hypothetical protein
MIGTALALAAASLLAAPPAAAQSRGKAIGKGPRVCLVTYKADAPSNAPASAVSRAQYLPLAIALKLQAKDATDIQQVLTFGPTGYAGPEVHPGGSRLNASQFDIPNSLTPTSSTEEACAVLADYANDRTDDENDG